MNAPLSNNDPAEWNLVAPGYDEFSSAFMGLFCERAIEDLALGANDRVLDVATGPGTLALRACPRVKRVLAVDFADEMLARLRTHVSARGITNLDVEHMNGMELRVADGSFDAAFSAFGLIFFPDRVRGFAELHRALAPGGRAAVLGWAGLDKNPFVAALIGGIRSALPELPAPSGPPPVLSLASLETFEREMTAGGFVDVRVRDVECALDIAGTIESMFEELAESNLLLKTLRPKLSEEKWTAVRQSVIASIGKLVGDGPIVMRGVATLGVGRRA